MSRKAWLIVVLVSLVFVFAFAVRLRVPGSGTLFGPKPTIVISNLTGKRLTSVFYGARLDSHYAVFKRNSESRHPECGGPASSSTVWTKLLAFAKSHGISSSSTVYAQAVCPEGCGYYVVYTADCAAACGGLPYEGYLVPADPSYGIGVGSVICTQGGCPGEAPTINCSCSSDDDDDDEDSIFDQDDQ